MNIVHPGGRQRARGAVVRPVARLEDMSNRATEGLVLVGEIRLQSMHAHIEITTGCRQQQMEVIRHDREGEQFPTVKIDDPKERLDEKTFGPVGGENRRPLFGAVVGMIHALV